MPFHLTPVVSETFLYVKACKAHRTRGLAKFVPAAAVTRQAPVKYSGFVSIKTKEKLIVKWVQFDQLKSSYYFLNKLLRKLRQKQGFETLLF